jgi:hypothetical protein
MARLPATTVEPARSDMGAASLAGSSGRRSPPDTSCAWFANRLVLIDPPSASRPDGTTFGIRDRRYGRALDGAGFRTFLVAVRRAGSMRRRGSSGGG